MAQIDTSIYAPVQRPNMLERAGTAATIANTVQQNKLLQTGLTKENLDIANTHMGNLRGMFSSLVTKPGALSRQDFYDVAAKGVKEGLWTPQQAAAELSGLPEDPLKLKDVATNYLGQIMTAQERLNAAYGIPQMVDTGGGIQPMSVSPINGVRPLSGPVSKTLTPAELSAPVPIGVTTQGQPITGTTNQALTREDPALAQRLGAPGAQPAAPAAPAAAAAVAPIQPLSPDGSAAAPAAPAASAAPAGEPGGGIVTTLPLGQAEGMQGAATASTAAWAAAQDYASHYVDRAFPLEHALESFERLGTKGTGPGTETFNQVTSFIQSLGIPGVDAQKIKDYDEANKYLTQYAMGRSTAMGQGTDSKLATALTGNPNTHISNLAGQELIKASLALERMTQARMMEFEASGGRPENFSRFASQWVTGQDPRAYAWDLLSHEEQKKLSDSLKGKERDRFNQSLKTAYDQGLILRPGQ